MARRYKLENSGGEFHSASGIRYADELNEQQLAAVTSGDGAALVIAGAGAGKTRTLTYRVAWLIDHGTRPENILLLTFTNKAAKEMLERVKSIVPVNLDSMWSGTFHSIANRILRRHATELGYTPSFSIMDSDDSKSMLKSIIKSMGLNDKKTKFPKAEVLSSILSLSVNTGEAPADVIYDQYPYLGVYLDRITGIFTAYAKRKLESNAMDFDDLLVNSVRLLEENNYLRSLYAERFRYVLVDEYQDTNALQSKLIDMLASKHGNLMVVGDDAQSIYSWRGADMEHILQFHIKHPEAATYKIETNYRSVPEILALSNAAIANNKTQIRKELRSVRAEGEMTPALIPLPDFRTQALFVGQRIEELIDQGLPESEIAVLYRAHYLSMEIQLELTRRHIPFRITSGIRFFEQAHIKDVLSFLRFFANPQDELSFKRMALLVHGIGAVAAEKLWLKWLNHVKQAAEHSTPINYLLLADLSVPAKSQQEWRSICDIIVSFAPNASGVKSGEPAESSITYTPSAMISAIVDSFYSDYMMTEFEDCEFRHQDLIQMAAYADRFETLDDFLSQMALLSNTDDENQQDSGRDKVTLSSIHQAKGLEWKVVFVVGLCDGMFPHQRAIEENGDSGMEEERRLFYVAITRAKDQLYLTYPRYNSRNYGYDYNLGPSRFLDEFPQDLVDEWVIE